MGLPSITKFPAWRLIPPITASGATQMALDAWLFEQHIQGLHPPTLRFYTWMPAAISLGYHQRTWPDFWHTLPLDLVRRPTGGRAVLHQGDLTYAIVTSGLPINRIQAYQFLCEFLIRGWRSLGVDLHYGRTGRGYIQNPNCFGTATGADLVLPDGAKLIGSAQLRRGNGVLQHGSMRLNPDRTLFEQVFGLGTFHPPNLALSEESLPEAIIEALTRAAQEHFCVNLEVCPLSEEEWQDVKNYSLVNQLVIK